MSGSVEAVARAWMARDPDPETRAATERLLETGDVEGLEACFGSRLQFGTAGLRGTMGPGPNRMNRVMVRMASEGLVRHLASVDPDRRDVVIGYDARKNSRAFAEDTACVFAVHGYRVHLFDDVVPTPVLANATVALGCAAGIMLTASHNPPADNGYKVYLANGGQIVPPHDRGISDAIDGLGELEPLPALSTVADRVGPVPQRVVEDYFAAVAALRVHREGGVRVVYTAMHGVGLRFVQRVLADAGHDDLHLVKAQVEPDGTFPTVEFPNPEEPGALDMARALGREVGADVIIANDPDADRLAVAVPDGRGGFLPLTGNQVGVLLTADLLESGPKDPGRMVATTIVSTAMLSRIAAEEGIAYVETLTGFKWIADAAIRHDAAGGRFVIGFEEALGYSVGPVVRDKDGVSAALLLVDLVAACKARGETLLDRLEQLYRRYGYYHSAQVSRVLPGAEGAQRIAEAMASLRAHPLATIGGARVVRTADLSAGVAIAADGTRSPVDLPRSDVLSWELEDGSRVLARPSGTEPKIKIYFEIREIMGGRPLFEAEASARARFATLRDDVLGRAGLGA